MREALWWIGAPQDTALDNRDLDKDASLDKLVLDLGDESRAGPSRFLQLAALKVERWVISGEPGHRLDRVPFSKAQRRSVLGFLTSADPTVSTTGWQDVVTSDGGRMRLFAKYLSDAANFDTLNILVEELTPQISAQIHGLMRECDWLLLPMAFAASEETASSIDCDWPEVTMVASADRLHAFLSRGPFPWWQERRGTSS